MRICMRVATKMRWSIPGMAANPLLARPHIATPWLPPTSCNNGKNMSQCMPAANKLHSAVHCCSQSSAGLTCSRLAMVIMLAR